MAHVVFAGREVWPFVTGGGIGRFVFTAAAALAGSHRVTILTSAAHRERYEELRAAGDGRLAPGAEYEFTSEPAGEVAPFSTEAQAWSFALLEGVRRLAPDVAEFADYAGEGFATVHARRAGDPSLAGTAVVVRVHAAAEIVYALDGRAGDPALAHLWAQERFPIRHADALLWPGGDVLERYERFYDGVADGVRAPLPLELAGFAQAPPPPRDGPLRALFLGRLQRVKGVEELVGALRAQPDLDMRLSLVGGDTDTAPGGGSMHAQLLELAGGDERIDLRGGVPHDEVAALIGEHHLLVLPTRWEPSPYVVREALASGRPVLATPRGTIPEVVVPGRSGWLADDIAEGLATVTLDAALALIDSGGPRAALEASLPSAADLVALYSELAQRGPRAASAAARSVAAIVAVQPGDAGLARTLASLRAQRDVELALVVAAPPAATSTEVTLLHEGDRLAGWAAGVEEVDADAVALLPAGAELDPDFLRRCLAALDGFDYATSFVARGRRPWHAPLGGEAAAVTGTDAAASVGVARRDALQRSFAREPRSERELWSTLTGVVIQEPLVLRYPRRDEDAGKPAHGGAPDPDSVARAFG